MNENYKRNLAFLARFFPHLAQRVECGLVSSCTLPFRFEPTRNGQPNAWLESRPIHDPHDPSGEARRWAEANPPRPGSVIVFLGWGLGYPVLEWIHRYGHKTDCALVLEPEESLFIQSLHCQDFTRLTAIPRLDFVLGLSGEEIYQSLHARLEALLNRDLQLIPMPFIDIYPPDFLRLLKEQVQRIIATRDAALEHMERMGALCQAHLIENIPVLLECHYPRKITPCGNTTPALIVAAGPSLDKNIHLLQEAKEKAWLFAVDTALGVLQSRGIVPDILVTKDPTDLNTRHFSGTRPSDQTILAFDPQVDPTIPPLFTGPKILMPHRNSDYTRYLSGLETTPDDNLGISTNVAIAAFNLAVKMGCNPIVFVGLDLCFSRQEGHSHASGTALRSQTIPTETGQMLYQRGEAKELTPVMRVEGIDGQLYPTTPNFFETKQLLERRIAETDANVFDASEGGARIRGTKVISLREVIDTLLGNPISPPVIGIRDIPQEEIRKVSESLEKIHTRLHEYSEKAAEALCALQTDAWSTTVASVRLELEKDYFLYRILHSALERLLVEVARPDFWDGIQSGDFMQKQKYAWYLGLIQSACQSAAPLFKKIQTDLSNKKS